MKLFDTTLETLQRSLDARLLRQNVLSGNLANADTPGYQPKDVDFDAAMRAASSADVPQPVATGEGHLSVDAGAPSAVGLVVQAEGAQAGIDGNGVDLDRAMTELAKNALQYGAAAKAAGKKLAILRYVASDGNG